MNIDDIVKKLTTPKNLPGTMIAVAELLEPIYVGPWWDRKIISYKCKEDGKRIPLKNMIKHYAECHYGRK